MQTCVALQQALADADAVCGWGSASDDLRISDVLDTDIDLLTIDFSDTFDVPACPGTEVALVNATTAMEEPRTTPQPHAPPPQTTPATAQPDESASALVELACSDHEKSAQELDVLFEQQQQILTRAASELQRGVPIGLLAQAPELQQLREVHMQLSQRLQVLYFFYFIFLVSSPSRFFFQRPPSPRCNTCWTTSCCRRKRSGSAAKCKGGTSFKLAR